MKQSGGEQILLDYTADVDSKYSLLRTFIKKPALYYLGICRMFLSFKVAKILLGIC